MVLVSLPAFTTSGWSPSLPGDLPLARYMMALSSSLINGVASSSCMTGRVLVFVIAALLKVFSFE